MHCLIFFNLWYVESLLTPNIMASKKKATHGSISMAHEAIPHDPFKPCHPPNEKECD